jgi:hypothetical protein
MGKSRFWRRVMDEGIYLRGMVYFHPRMKAYVGKKLMVFSDGSNYEVYTTTGVFICYLKKDDGIKK